MRIYAVLERFIGVCMGCLSAWFQMVSGGLTWSFVGFRVVFDGFCGTQTLNPKP